MPSVHRPPSPLASAGSGPPQCLVMTTKPTLDPELLGTARGQHGMLTTRQANKAGLSAAMLVALVKTRVLRHPGRGLYAVEAFVDPAPEGWHRQLCAGALIVYPDATLAGTSAVLAHGIPVWGAPLATPSILRPVKPRPAP